jgi:hypothetical protein
MMSTVRSTAMYGDAMKQLLIVAALVALSVPVSPAALAAPLYQERVCEGVVKKREDPNPPTWAVPVYEFGSVDKQVDPIQFGVGTCWVNDLKAPQHSPIVSQILKVCQAGDRCHIKAYGECQFQLPRIVEFPQEVKNCPSGFAVERIIEVRKVKPPLVGCFTRTYDRQHLARHPDQLITAVKLKIYPSSGPEHLLFAIQMRRRGEDKTLHNGGYCKEEGSTMRCNIECDGGGVNVMPRSPSTIFNGSRPNCDGGVRRPQ